MDGKPLPRRRPKTLAADLEALSRPVFQAGMSWRDRCQVGQHPPGVRRLDPRTVADFGPGDIERLLGDPRMVRSKPKIEAAIDNAQALLELDAEYGGFAHYLDSQGGFDATVADLKQQFRLIGDSGAYHFLYAIDPPVPPHDEWFAARRRPQRRRRDVRAAMRRAATGGA